MQETKKMNPEHVFKTTCEVRWADLDPNFHVRHSAYADYAAHVRVRFLESHGFTAEKLRQLNIGPILFSERLDYFKEVRSGDTVTIHLWLSEISDDNRKWTFRHEIFRSDGEKAAEVTVSGAWLDITKRKIVAPPKELAELIQSGMNR